MNHLNLNYVARYLDFPMMLSSRHSIQINVTELTKTCTKVLYAEFTREFHGNSLHVHVQSYIVS